MKLFDLANLIFCFFLGALIVDLPLEKVSFARFLSMRVKIQNVMLFGSILLIWHTIFSRFGLYHSKRLSTYRSDAVDIIKATSVGTLAIFVMATLFNIRMANINFLAVLWAVCCVNAVLSRLMLRYVLKRFRVRGRNLRKMLIIGTNYRAVRFATGIEAKPELGYRLAGFVDNDWSGLEEFQNTGYPLVANLAEFPAFLRNHIIDEVVICLPIKSCYQQASQIVSLCEEQGIISRFLSDIFNLKLARLKSEPFEDSRMVTLYTGNMEGQSVVIKQGLDFIISLSLIICLSPLFLLIALLIKASSPGPVLFIQERLGLNKRRFRMFKFRTMIPDAEQKLPELEHLNEAGGPVFKIRNDPRITTFGRFLRKTSLDELPQFINVLLGDMSLVGPRPLPLRDYAGFDQDWHRRRFSVRPGMTCLWQISGRNNVSFEKWMELDIQYIDQWSLWSDFKILARTIPAVLKGAGAA
ncbi:MAG: sugar transferase [Geobacter sp.]|nr:sugar transferase [Geobacter sp.]